MVASYNQHPFDNGWGWLLHEYLKRKALAEIGYTSNLEDLDDRLADGFMIISNKIKSLQAEEMKRGRK